jgi:hypothetical protein
MRATLLALCVAVALATACTSDRADQANQPSPPAQTPPPDEETIAHVQIYAAVIRRLVTRDHTFGRGPSPFDSVYVVNGALNEAGDPLGGDLFGPAPERFPSQVVEGIKEELQDLPPLRFIGNGSRARRGTQGVGGVKKNGVIISLGPVVRKSGRVQVANGLWCGSTCGQWLTYVLRRAEGQWTIAGTTGPYIIS